MEKTKHQVVSTKKDSDLECPELALEGAIPKEALAKTTLDPGWSFTIHIIPQSHIDLAWMWTRQEAVEMILETFRGHAEALEADPSRTYAQSQIVAYWIVEQEDPGLFKRIVRLVKKGQWEIVGGEWVEPDNAIPCGESRVRQLLLGQRYVQEKFGRLARVAWCPDSFSHHPGNLPQIWKQAELHFLALKRPREKFISLPLVPFRWRAYDGSEILVHRSNNKGFGFPLISEGTNIPLGQNDLTIYARAFRQAGLKDLWAPLGVGDVGGVNHYANPQKGTGWHSRYSLPSQFFEKIISSGTKQLPVIQGDIGPIQVGCLTTHAEMKWLNREAESKLLLAEFLDALGYLLIDLPVSRELELAWQRVLFNQFHDVITGTGTPEVHRAATHDYIEACQVTDGVIRRAARALTSGIKVKGKGIPLAVFNGLGWKRSDVVEAWVDLGRQAEPFWQAIDLDGDRVPVVVHRQREHQGKWRRYDISFVAQNVPAMGYRLFYLVPAKANEFPKMSYQDDRIRTEKFQASFDTDKGELIFLQPAFSNHSLVPEGKALGKWCIHEEGKYELDYGEELRAWYLGLSGKSEPVKPAGFEVVEQSAGQILIRIRHSHGQSQFRQDFIFRPGLARIDVKVTLDWQEVERLLRLHFPIVLQGQVIGRRDEPYGYCFLSPDGKERPMQYWCDLSDKKCGLAVLNFGRYGCSSRGNELTISAIRCATYPDPRSDRGKYIFRYALLPHPGSWSSADLMRHGYSFNHPLFAFPVHSESQKFPEELSLLHSTDYEVLPVILKRGLQRDTWILRVFHVSDQSAIGELHFAGQHKGIYQCNLLEQSFGKMLDCNKAKFNLPAQGIVSFKIQSWKLVGEV